jgi:hypothetical protein
MTIAACYLSPEGVVFGADSTTTLANHYYNYAQKIFEIGESGSTLGVVMWGLGGLGDLSYRTLIARFAVHNSKHPTASVQEIATRFGQFFWPEYQARMAALLARFHHLAAQAQLTPDEQTERANLLQGLSGGFCLGGNLRHDPAPSAFAITYGPTFPSPVVQAIPVHVPMFWGQPNLLHRLAVGIDEELFRSILQSGMWVGTPDDLLSLVNPRRLAIPGILPIRESIDWLHGSIYATIKLMKFSQLAPACGGPVELAVVTTDRPFRWVRHKRFDAAIPYGEALNA